MSENISPSYIPESLQDSSDKLTSTQVLDAFASKQNELTAALSELKSRPGINLNANQMMAKRREEVIATEDLDSFTAVYQELGGADVDAAQAQVDALSFKSDATDHVRAKAALSAARSKFYENFIASQNTAGESIETHEELIDDEPSLHDAADESPSVPVPAEMVEDAVARLNERAEDMEREANEARNNTDQAKADKELLASAKAGDEEAEGVADASGLELLDESPAMSADDLEILSEGEVSHTPRSRTRRIRDSFTLAGAGSEFSTWVATREKMSGRKKIAALLGGAALMAIFIGAKAKGFDFDNPFNNGDTPSRTGESGPDVLSKPNGTSTVESTPTPTPKLVETVRVNPGDGEIKVTQRILENHGVHVDALQAQRIGESANVHDILKADASYVHSGSTMDRIGGTGDFRVRNGVVDKLLASASKLGFRK